MAQLVRTLLKPLNGLFGARTAPEACTPQSPLTQDAALELRADPNGDADVLRFTVNRPLLPDGETLRYTAGEPASRSPLAQALLGVPGVREVALERATVSVTWDPTQERGAMEAALQQAITRFHASGQAAVTAAKRYSFGFKQVPVRAREEQLALVERLFEEEVNPAVASHGGHFSLVDVKDNSVYVRLEGGCQGCGMANVTLKQGVEGRLRQVMPELVALVDVTDHAGGTNPYYQQSKK